MRAFLKAGFRQWNIAHSVRETRDLAARYLGLSPEKIRPDDNLKLYNLNDNRSLFDIQTSNSIYSITKITSDYLISNGVMAEAIDPLELLDLAYLP
ncbi:MAG: hypothetical protein MZV64_03890 [Ignavibacteriales bacterium]|nr:hypothetical protein [Ignavibacteriales bacterium]